MRLFIRIIIITAFSLTFYNLETYAQNEDPKQDSITIDKGFVNYLGFGAGFTTGYGLSYRYWPKYMGAFGFQFNFAPMRSGSTNRYSYGLSMLLSMVETKTVNLYLYQGNHLYSTYNISNNSNNQELYNGIGIGLEFLSKERVSYNLMGGIAAFESFSKYNFTGELAIYYKF